MGLMQHFRGQKRFTTVRPATRGRRGAHVEPVEPRVLLAAAPLGKEHPLGKIDHNLRDLHADFVEHVRDNNGRAEGFKAGNKLVRARGSFVAVEAVASGDPKDLVKELKALGMRDVSVAGALAGGLMPIDALDDLAGKDAVQFARPSVYRTMAELESAPAAGGEPSVTSVGATTSQADAALQADVARSQYGVNGAGSVVGVISDSFNTSGNGSYAADVSSGDLPTGVNVLADLAGGTDEGRAMAQLVHDVAPGAGLSFHAAGGSQAAFANGITALRNNGADVIVDDILFLAEPMFQDGVIAQSADAAVAAGVPYFSAAGNMGSRSYESGFRRGTTFASNAFPVSGNQAPGAFYGGVAHDFNPSDSVNDPYQSFTLSPGQDIVLSFQWDSPAASAGGPGTPNDLDVYVFDANGSTVVGGAANGNVDGDPVEVFGFRNSTGSTQTYNLMLVKWGNLGPDPAAVKYVNFGPQHDFAEYNTNSATTYGHANAAGASAVAAAAWYQTPEFGQSPPLVEPYSSRGGTPIYFNKSGARLATPQVRNKPRITAPDGTNTTFFGFDIPEDSDSFPNFFGTSAAAPHAAAVAALMQDAAGFIAPSAIYNALESTALDMDNPDTGGTFDAGRDNATGFGLVRADLAVGAVAVTDTTAPTADVVNVSPDPRTTAVDTIQIKFSEAVEGFGLEDVRLTRDAATLDLSGATLSTTDDVTFTLGNLAGKTGAAGDYVLTVVTTGATPVTDRAGNKLAASAFDQWMVNAAEQAVTLRAAADAYVRDGSTYASTNFGAATQLQVKQGTTGYTRQSYLRFDMSSAPSVGTAKLRLFGKLDTTLNSGVGFRVYNAASNSWGESTITNSNKPASGTTVRGSGTVSGTTAKWYEVDLTSFLKAEFAAGRKVVSLVIKGAATSDSVIQFESDESATAANRPQLVITPATATQGLVVSTSSLSVPEGGSAGFTVKLAAQPTSDVTVAVAKASGGDADLTTAAGSLTFTSGNWNVAQTVNVAAAEDSDTTNGTASFTVSSAGLTTKTVAATEADNDAPATAVTLRAAADTYVRDGSTHASTNFGAATQMQVKKGDVGWNREAYLRFDLSSVSAVTNAKLRLFGKLDNTAATSAGFTLFNSGDTTWSESGITHNSKLTAGTTVRGTGTVTGTTAKWYEVDLTNFLKAEKEAGRNLVTLVIRASATSGSTIVFESDEATNKPQLVVS